MKNFKKAVYTFFASIIMVYLESKLGCIKFILSLLSQLLSLPETTQKDLFVSFLSFMTSFITFLIEDLIEKNNLNIHVKYYDLKKKKLTTIKQEITYESDTLPINYIGMEISLKYSKLCRFLFSHTKILISLNPKIGKLDLKDNFIDAKDSHFEPNSRGILYDFTKDFLSSNKYTSIIICLVVQCNKSGKGEIQVSLMSKGFFSKIMLILFKWVEYFKIDSSELSIKSENEEN